MDAISFLIKEHNKVRRKLAVLNKESQLNATKKIRFISLCHDLILHETMEQKIWYPYFRNDKKLKKEVKHLLSEENHAAMAIKKFKSFKTKAQWDLHFAKLKKAVLLHAKEEEKKLFPNVKMILDKSELNAIGIEMHRYMASKKKKK